MPDLYDIRNENSHSVREQLTDGHIAQWFPILYMIYIYFKPQSKYKSFSGH